MTPPTRDGRRRVSRDLTRKETRVLAKKLLAEARQGDRAAAEMLVDVAIGLGFPGEADRIAYALRGWSYPSKAQLPPDAAARELRNALDTAASVLTPARRSPCTPNRRALARLLSDTLELDTREGRRLAGSLWKAMENACETRRIRDIDRAMRLANDLMRGHGVEHIHEATERGYRFAIDYVNMGDTYNETLLYHDRRFLVSSWGDVLERFERRWGRLP